MSDYSHFPPWLEYDVSRSEFTIHGQKYAEEIFENLGELLPIGAIFRLVERKDGVLTIERLYNPFLQNVKGASDE